MSDPALIEKIVTLVVVVIGAVVTGAISLNKLFDKAGKNVNEDESDGGEVEQGAEATRLVREALLHNELQDMRASHGEMIKMNEQLRLAFSTVMSQLMESSRDRADQYQRIIELSQHTQEQRLLNDAMMQQGTELARQLVLVQENYNELRHAKEIQTNRLRDIEQKYHTGDFKVPEQRKGN